MTIIYILLTIIAIGVLLASKAGQELLNILWKLALIAGGLYLGFWIVVLAMGLLSDKGTRDNIYNVFEVIILIALVVYGIYTVYKKYKRGEFKKEIIKKKVKDLWLKNWNESTGSKIAIIFIILAFTFIIGTMIYGYFNQCQ